MVTCEPLYATPRTSRRSDGPEVSRFARNRLAVRLMPWQKGVLNVALEQRRGHRAYRDVYVGVPRQSGKTTLIMALIMWTMDTQPGSSILYGAQTRVAARRKLLHSWWPALARSPLADDLSLFRGFGNESIRHANGSVLELLSSGEASGHGDTCDLAVVDEAWARPDARTEQSVRPTMATRPDAQLWAVSTAGTSRSVWWKDKLDAGRNAAQMAVDSGICCVEYGAPDGANPADEATWQAAMPALGRTITPETVAVDLASMGVDEFRRAYLNQWPDAVADGWAMFSKAAFERARQVEDEPWMMT